MTSIGPFGEPAAAVSGLGSRPRTSSRSGGCFGGAAWGAGAHSVPGSPFVITPQIPRRPDRARSSAAELLGAIAQARAGGAHLTDALLARLRAEPGDQLVGRHGAEVRLLALAHGPVADRHRARRLLLLADDGHVRPLLQPP